MLELICTPTSIPPGCARSVLWWPNSLGGWQANVLHAVPPVEDHFWQAEKRGTPAHQRLQRRLWGVRGVPIDKAVALSQT
jgi:hypothetical protein